MGRTPYPSERTLTDLIDKGISSLPAHAGVYFFKDALHTIIYVGKAKSLRARLRSYFGRHGQDWKVDALFQDAVYLDYILTKTETEALLLEAHMIQDYQPKYNVLLKDGQPFVYIMFTEGDVPQMHLVRNKAMQGVYFGPFLQKNQARNVFLFLQRTFRLKICGKSLAHGCLDYHLGLCSGLCRGPAAREEYLVNVALARKALEGNLDDFRQQVMEQIAHYNGEYAFEKSARLARYLEDVEQIFRTLAGRFDERRGERQMLTKASQACQTVDNAQAAQELQRWLCMDREPLTIDCFDISHFQSHYLVGSCVRFTAGQPDKQKFRRFKIKTLAVQNDYAALQEVVARRYRNPEDLPDVIFVDGGKGQRNAVKHLFPDVPCISLAKKEEILFADAFPDGISLDVHEPASRQLIALRDYAHHFAISYHRLLRHKHREQTLSDLKRKRL